MNYKKIIIALIAILIIIQFKRIDTINPVTDSTKDYVVIAKAPQEIRDLLRTSCYDCHSNETNYPWYSNIAPVSWYVGNHIKEGRRHLNFSEWGNYEMKRKIKKLEDCVTELEEDEMPLSSYTLIHAHAKLSAENKATLIEWFKSPPETN